MKTTKLEVTCRHLMEMLAGIGRVVVVVVVVVVEADTGAERQESVFVSGLWMPSTLRCLGCRLVVCCWLVRGVVCCRRRGWGAGG